MSTPSFRPGPREDLSKIDIEALLSVKAGVRLSDGMYTRLELHDLASKGLDRWLLTPTGEYRLQLGK